MRAPCGEIHVQCVQIDLQVRHGLTCVKHNHCAHLVRTLHNRRNIGDGTSGVAYMGDGHDLRTLGDYLICGVGKDSSLIVQIKPFQCRSGTCGKFLEWQQHRMMFSFGYDNLVSRLHSETSCRFSPTPLGCVTEGGRQQIQSCRGAGSDDDFLLAFNRIGTDKTRHLGTRLLERHGAACGKFMRSTMHTGVDGAIEIAFGVDHALRLLRSRRGIQINELMAVNFLIENRKFPTDRREIGHASALSESAPSGRYAS